jgi:hypothetical protein
MKSWLIIAAVLLVGWLLLSRMVVSLAVAGGAVWCAWWVLSTR